MNAVNYLMRVIHTCCPCSELWIDPIINRSSRLDACTDAARHLLQEHLRTVERERLDDDLSLADRVDWIAQNGLPGLGHNQEAASASPDEDV